MSKDFIKTKVLFNEVVANIDSGIFEGLDSFRTVKILIAASAVTVGATFRLFTKDSNDHIIKIHEEIITSNNPLIPTFDNAYKNIKATISDYTDGTYSCSVQGLIAGN